MGATKYEIYPSEVVEFTELLKAVAHPARMQAVLLIAESTDEDITTKELQAEIKLSQATLSQHLKVLTHSGVLKTKVVKKNNKCCLSYRIEREVLVMITQIIGKILKNTDLKSDSNYTIIEKFHSRFQACTNWQSYFKT